MVEAADYEPDAWPKRRTPILEWLIHEARHLPDGAALLAELCARLVEAGVPLRRVGVHLRLLHPQLFGTGFYWHSDSEAVRITRAEHGIEQTELFLNSPVRMLIEGAGAVRQRLDLPDVELRLPLFQELQAEGLTDYVALPITFSDGKIHGTTWASDRPGGFATADLEQIDDILPVAGLLLEIHLNRLIAATLLDTYIGHSAGERILNGQIRRGTGETLRAAIWYCDLRGFTQLSEILPRDQLIGALNEYFECIAAPIARHGGEIMKFMGDAMLAVFRLSEPDAHGRALRATLEARDAMAELNLRRQARGERTLGYGIALHAGEVMYGNIGAPDRLDFTVIGPAVNQTVRIEALCRTLDRQVLVSASFAAACGAEACGEQLVPVGQHWLRGVSEPAEIFTLPEAA